MKLIIVRHGETVWNAEGREMGQLDAPLTERGLDQIRQLADRIGREPVAAIYSSDIGRALRTAEAIAGTCHVAVQPEPGLRERNMGIFQGLQQTPSIASALDNTGLKSAVQNLVCVGGAAPTPDWNGYFNGTDPVPSQCANGASPTLVNTSPNVTLFDPNFVAPKSYRIPVNFGASAMGAGLDVSEFQPRLMARTSEPIS